MLLTGVSLRAQPRGGQVVAGAATFATAAGALTVSQTSDRAIINWQDFSLATGELARFVQPAATSATLNRVISGLPSTLAGTLQAIGRVYLINPNGILIGASARIETAGFLASTLDLANQEFLAGGDLHFGGDSTAAILNLGTINVRGGDVFLIARRVENSGSITAGNGSTGLAAGSEILLTVGGAERLFVRTSSLPGTVVNAGTIAATTAELKAAGGNAFALAINNSGTIRATSSELRQGEVWLVASGGDAAVVSVSGTIDASAKGAGQTGGNVSVLGRYVGLYDKAAIDVSGDAGGGTALIGGNFQGKGPEQNATATYLSANATITADAITQGSGGKVVLWANDSTRAYGSITARGGAQGGDGGLIETSGHWLDVAGINVNASASNGKGGTWLLDPADVTITDAMSSGGSFSGGDPDVFTPGSGLSTANVNLTAITTALNLGTDVTITTANNGTNGSGNGDISVDAVITWDRAAPLSILTLSAFRDVNVNFAITATNGSFVANAGRDVNVKAVITTTDGNVVLRADNDGTGPGVAGGTVAFLPSGSVTMTRGAATIQTEVSSTIQSRPRRR